LDFARLIEPLVDAGVPVDEHHPLRVRHLRVVSVGTLLVVALAAPFAFLFYRAQGGFLATALLVALALALANLALLRRSGRIDVCGNVATGLLFAVLTGVSAGSGGFHDPGFGWLYVVPLAGFVMVGLRSGLCWTAATLTTMLAFWWLPRAGLPIADLLPVDVDGSHGLASHLAAVLAVAALALTLISSQRAAEGSLKRASDNARAASRAKSDFVAAMSHEIRTPMTAILGYTEILGEEHDVTPEQRCVLGIIRRNGEHLLQVINDVLDLSKIEAGRLDVERTRFSPVDVVREVEGLMWVRADAKGLALTLECEGPMPATISGDPLRFQQALLNLVSNAIKFTERGSVRIAMRQIPSDMGTNLEVEVIDTGIGLSPEESAQLFLAFAQAEVSTARRFGGTGLGLAICARLCELMYGAIDVRSEKGKGSTFRLTLFDVAPDGIVELHEDSSLLTRDHADFKSATRNYQGVHILLAEDSPDNQRLIRHILVRTGAQVTVVDNGRVALELALEALENEAPFDLILMDMQMPELDGYDATRELRSAGYGLPIVALTAHALSHLRARCFEAGCDDFATKPIDRPKLFAALDRQLGRLKEPAGDL
jgi:signal transduction histidine kinase/CheY-like chemotaxis protein